jgi:spermidine synthase
MQIGIGLYALVFPYMLRAVEHFYAPLYVSLSGSFASLTLLRICAASVLLLLPTLMMGGSLPLVLRAMVRNLDGAGRDGGTAYGINTLGAACGSFLGGFVLMKAFGTGWTSIAAAAASIASGILAAIAAGPSPPPEDTPRDRAAPTSLSRAETATIACFALAGFAGMGYEMLWHRYLVLYFLDTIYLYTGIVTVFILGLGIGSLAGGRMISRARSPAVFFALTQVAAAVLAALAFWLPVPFHSFISKAGIGSAFGVQAFLFLMLLAPTMCMGAGFPAIVRIVTDSAPSVGRRVGTAYAFNTLGSIAGALAAVLLLIPLVGMHGVLIALFLVNMLVASAMLLVSGEPRYYRWAWAPVLLCVCYPVIIKFGVRDSLPRAVLRRIAGDAVEIATVREGVTGTTWVTRTRMGTDLRENAVTISRSYHEGFNVQGFIPMLLAPRVPQRVLGLTFAAGLSCYGPRMFPEVRRVDCVDISRENVKAGLEHFPQNKDWHKDSRLRFFYDDARNFVRYSEESYGLILVEATPPAHSFRNASLFTREFYENSLRRLETDGLFMQILPLGDLSEAETLGIMKTFSSVFPQCALWFNGGSDTVMLGGREKIHLSPYAITARQRHAGIRRALKRYSRVAGFHVPGNFMAGFLLDDDAFREVAADGVVYTEDRLALKYSTARRRSSAHIDTIRSRMIKAERVAGHIHDKEKTQKNVEAMAKILPRIQAYFAVNLYGDELICEKMLEYIEKYSTNKEEDLRKLHDSLRARGRHEDAERVMRIIKRKKGDR